MASKAERRWQGFVADWRCSGLTQAAYCRRHDLSAHRFSHWKRRLDSARSVAEDGSPSEAVSASSITGFVPGLAEVKLVSSRDDAGDTLSPGPSSGYVSPLEVEWRRDGGVVFRWPEGIDPSILDRLLLWLERTSC